MHQVSRKDVIDWVNDVVITHLTKIEQLGSGNIYCQLLDAAFPGQVPLHKVKWSAYLEVDFLHNFKILQTCFQKLMIKKQFNPQKLAKAKYQDNWEFIQWFKGEFEHKIAENGSYNACGKRDDKKIYLLGCDKIFDMRQTVTHRDNKQNQEKKMSKMINSMSSKLQESALKSTRSVLGLKTMNSNVIEMSKSVKKTESIKKLAVFKENVKPFALVDTSKAKKQKMSVVSKPVLLKAVEVIESDEEQCF